MSKLIRLSSLTVEKAIGTFPKSFIKVLGLNYRDGNAGNCVLRLQLQYYWNNVDLMLL